MRFFEMLSFFMAGFSFTIAFIDFFIFEYYKFGIFMTALFLCHLFFGIIEEIDHRKGIKKIRDTYEIEIKKLKDKVKQNESA